jgi:hypothetical protein
LRRCAGWANGGVATRGCGGRAGACRACRYEGGDGSGAIRRVGVIAVHEVALDGALLDRVGSDQGGLLGGEDGGTGIFALGVFERLAFDGVDLDIGYRDDLETADRLDF